MATDTSSRDLVPQTSLEVAPLVKFTIFSKLPPELRDMIWKLAISNTRVIKLSYGRHAYKFALYRGHYNPPLLHANHESRSVGLSIYQPIFSALTGQTIYFNFASDWLYTTLSMLWHFQNQTQFQGSPFHFIKSDELLFRHVMLSKASPNLLPTWAECAGQFPNLETLEIGVRYGRPNWQDRAALGDKLREERARSCPGQAETRVIYRTLNYVEEFPRRVNRDL